MERQIQMRRLPRRPLTSGVNSSLVGIFRIMVQSMKIMVVDSTPALLVLSLLIIVKRKFQKM